MPSDKASGVPQSDPNLVTVQELARLLTERRIQKGLSKNQLSQKAGLGLTTISYIERGIRSPSFDSLLRIAVVLDIELWKLIREASSAAERHSKRQGK